tara:strand:- start:2367 stop:3689 length:1323 start_codon:yes stop_codon:yes gene_type:complete
MTGSQIAEVSPKYLVEAEECEVPSGYKLTEVGVIPDDWQSCELGDVLTLQRGFDLPQRLRVFGKVPIVSSSGATGYHNQSMVSPPGIVTGRYGTIGQVFYLTDHFWPLNTTLYVREFKGLVPLFAFHLLKTVDFESHSGKSGVPGVNRNDVHQERVYLPPLKEQAIIANALSDVDALLTELEKLITKKQAIKIATMQQLLTGRTRLPQFALREDGSAKGYKQSELGAVPEDWGLKTVYELAGSKKALFDDGDWVETEHITDKGIRLIQTGNISIGRYLEKSDKKYIYQSSFDKLGCKELEVGDLLICRLAEPAGRACIFPDIGEYKVITSVDVTIFRPPADMANRSFYVQYFSFSEWFRSVLEQVGGTTHKRISRGALGKISVPYPTIREQTAIAAILSDMDKEIQALEQRLDKTRQIKQGMMQELLTGKTRLVTPQVGE